MDNQIVVDQPVLSGILMGIKFNILTETELDKYTSISIEAANDVTDPRLGLPNLSDMCSTCGAKDINECEGHFGVVKFPADRFHPYFMPEASKILNDICPGCKSIRRKPLTKGSNDTAAKFQPLIPCKYCTGNAVKRYPRPKFKPASKDQFGKNCGIIVEVTEKVTKNLNYKNPREALPADYWDFIKKDPQQEPACFNNRRNLSPAQVNHILRDIDLNFIGKYIARPESLFLTCIPVTPNCNRVVETPHEKLMFCGSTRVYKRLMDFKRQPNEIDSRARDCLISSKLLTQKLSADSGPLKSDSTRLTGKKWLKDVVLGKRTDNALRMVVVGDPKIRLCEIGIPEDISQSLVVSETINSRNWEMTNSCYKSLLLENGQCLVRKDGKPVNLRMNRHDRLQLGDTIYRPLRDGDIVLVNRNPSVHQHSLIALSVRILPTNCVVSINPLCCSPLRGDFDGDCLHGFIPQSVNSRVELKELVSLNQQLLNGQNGRSLLQISHDSLTAAYLIRENDVFLNKHQIQQLAMLFPRPLLSPAILKAPRLRYPIWTGKQLFGMLMPQCLDYVFPMNDVIISKGEMLSSTPESTWLQDRDGDIFSTLVKTYGGKALDVLFNAQEVLLEWISMRGFSVSLADIYLLTNFCSESNVIDEVRCGLQEAQQACHVKEMLMDRNMEHLLRYGEEHTSNYNERSFVLTQVSDGAFKEVFRDIQNLIHHYACNDNSMLAMLRAGSKGNLMKLVQQSLCLGLQHSSVPISFKIPSKLSYPMWHHETVTDLQLESQDNPRSSISYAVVESSFLSGLNPYECFVHSLSYRGSSSFSENADLPGSLTRKIMFYMRDVFVAYDGTVRNAYGNQVVQFSYGMPEVIPVEDSNCHLMGHNSDGYDGCGGQPVGSLAACSISDTAYSALDLPISTVETSPLLNLKKILESGVKKTTACQTISLFLSKKLQRWTYGSEYGALEVKSHLERVLFSDVISTALIVYSGDNYQTCFSPWVCHFHIRKETLRIKGLKLQYIMDALSRKYNSTGDPKKIDLRSSQILSRECSIAEEETKCSICITVETEMPLDEVRGLVMPVLLETVVKGIPEVQKVDIIWNDLTKVPKSQRVYSGELHLKLLMSEACNKLNSWSIVQNACIPIMDWIDWERSHPDNIYNLFHTYGIGAACKYFLKGLKSATDEVGKTILQKHLLLVADCFSVTGEFHGLGAKGIVSSPFIRACFSKPGPSFLKAAKDEAVDELSGCLDALAWGKEAPIGTGGHFDIMYSGQGQKLDKPLDICNTLCCQLSSKANQEQFKAPNDSNTWDKWAPTTEGRKSLKEIPESTVSSLPPSPISCHSKKDVLNMRSSLQAILNKYQLNQHLSETDKYMLMDALQFHPHGNEKMGVGVQSIKVVSHAKHHSRCFSVIRTDDTEEDFSYRKCVIGAAQRISPEWGNDIKKQFKERFDLA